MPEDTAVSCREKLNGWSRETCLSGSEREMEGGRERKKENEREKESVCGGGGDLCSVMAHKQN